MGIQNHNLSIFAYSFSIFGLQLFLWVAAILCKSEKLREPIIQMCIRNVLGNFWIKYINSQCKNRQCLSTVVLWKWFNTTNVLSPWTGYGIYKRRVAQWCPNKRDFLWDDGSCPVGQKKMNLIGYGNGQKYIISIKVKNGKTINLVVDEAETGY